jgi:hypothetical protein
MNGDILMLMPQCASEKLLELHFGQSSFTATVPKFIGNFTSLRTLDLSNNDFSGMIVEKHFAGLISLKYLDLSSNNLEVVMRADWFPPYRLEYGLFASCHMGQRPHISTFPKTKQVVPCQHIWMTWRL